MKMRNQLKMWSALILVVSLSAFTSCSNDSGTDESGETNTEEMSQEQKESVIEMENLTEEITDETEQLQNDADKLETEVDSLLEDI